MLPKIIGIVGFIRSGKTTASTYLAERYGYKFASNSDILRDIAGKLAIQPSRDNLKRLGDAIFSTLGNEVIARFRIKEEYDSPIVIDGIRYKEELDVYFQEPSFKLLGLQSSDEARYLRAVSLAHEGKDALLTQSQFNNLSLARSEENVANLLQSASYVINNDKGIEEIKRRIDDFIKPYFP
ncbi:AAA family ATPase [Variovorax sp. YR266]|uniref:AAA family ATPase n=1 Tax=Variovorax sp. YR266 TaxID=1884386 RepID=UPI000B87741D|nr:AAA family ATPase [Variovorax sp. YR266]